MAKLIKTKTEWEGAVRERSSVAEGNEPSPWSPDKEFRIIGQKQPRIDGVHRVTGRAVYTSDIILPGMLHARVLRSPHPHARIKNINVDRAMALPGVRAVVSHLNSPSITWVNDLPLFDTTVRYVGDEVAAVAAEDEYTADEALHLIEIDYEVLPHVVDIESAMLPDAPQIHSEGNLVNGAPRKYDRGDVKSGFDKADVIVENNFQTQPVLHNCMETHGTVAQWNGDELIVWESTQSVNRVKEDLAEAFNLPLHRVRVICEYMGSGFGSKQFAGEWSFIAAILAKMAGRPVRLMMTRREENLCTGHRISTSQHIKIGAKRDGTLTAIDLTAKINVGAYGRRILSVEGPVQIMYACPNIHTEVSSIYTNIGGTRSFRGPGYVEGNFPLESALDDIAAELGIDPIDLRIKNHANSDQNTGRPYSAKNLEQCYRKGVELIGWNKQLHSNGRIYRGMGMASQTWGGGGGPPAYAWVKLNSDNTAEVIVGSQDVGTGTRTVFAQIAAEELGIDVERIAVHLGDTAHGPYDPVSWGSMTVSSVGPAVRQAAIDVRNQLSEVIADLLEIPPEKIELRAGNIYEAGETKPRGEIKDIVEQLSEFTILGRGARGPNDSSVEVRTFGAQFAEVEVNIATGEITVPHMVTVHDFGRVINLLGAGSQAEGAVIQGIGYSLMEQRVIDSRYGVVLNPDLEDYLVPTSFDFEKIDYSFINVPDDSANNLGAKGLGEPALIPTAPAIANAIKKATGIRVTSLPVTRDKILEALHK